MIVEVSADAAHKMHDKYYSQIIDLRRTKILQFVMLKSIRLGISQVHHGEPPGR